MKTTLQSALLGICLASMNVVAENYDPDLEPCINGAVSSSGLFHTQGAEDRFILTQLQSSNLDLEACINGAVSTSGLFPSQEAEERFHLRNKNRYSRNNR